MRLIDADELVRNIDELSKGAGFYRPIYEGFSKAIRCQTTIDAVPVVRCKECMRGCKSKLDKDAVWCSWFVVENRPDGFCSYGERKDGEGK